MVPPSLLHGATSLIKSCRSSLADLTEGAAHVQDKLNARCSNLVNTSYVCLGADKND